MAKECRGDQKVMQRSENGAENILTMTHKMIEDILAMAMSTNNHTVG